MLVALEGTSTSSEDLSTKAGSAHKPGHPPACPAHTSSTPSRDERRVAELLFRESVGPADAPPPAGSFKSTRAAQSATWVGLVCSLVAGGMPGKAIGAGDVPARGASVRPLPWMSAAHALQCRRALKSVIAKLSHLPALDGLVHKQGLPEGIMKVVLEQVRVVFGRMITH
jgi:hypothetical protein